jgi:hypothetical protein
MGLVKPMRDQTDLVIEGIVATSERPDRLRFGLDRDQTSTQVRVSLRTSF